MKNKLLLAQRFSQSSLPFIDLHMHIHVSVHECSLHSCVYVLVCNIGIFYRKIRVYFEVVQSMVEREIRFFVEYLVGEMISYSD